MTDSTRRLPQPVRAVRTATARAHAGLAESQRASSRGLCWSVVASPVPTITAEFHVP